MNRLFLLISSLLLALTVAVAQDAPAAKSADPQEQSPPTHGRAANSQSSVVRGCLTGSAGNYTLTDQNGMHYKLTGSDTALQAKIGHEVEITGMEAQSGAGNTADNDSAAPATNSIEVSDIRDVSNTCNLTHPGGAKPTSYRPTHENAAPQLVAMLQQQGAPDAGTHTPKGSSAKQSSPPVTSQTPASPTSPDGSAAGPGSSPANQTGMTPDEANRDAQAARQGELNTNPKTGETSGRGVDNQGVNNPKQTGPNAVPTSRNSTTPSSTPQSSGSPDSTTPSAPPKQ